MRLIYLPLGQPRCRRRWCFRPQLPIAATLCKKHTIEVLRDNDPFRHEANYD